MLHTVSRGIRQKKLKNLLKNALPVAGRKVGNRSQTFKGYYSLLAKREFLFFYTISEGSKNLSNVNVAVKGNIFGHSTLLEGAKGTWIGHSQIRSRGTIG